MKKILSIILIIFTLNSVVNCDGQNKNNITELTEKLVDENSSPINFLDRKYFTNYELDTHHEYPTFFYRSNSLGEFSVNFIAQESESQNFWRENNEILSLYMGIETSKEEDIKINQLIKEKLESNFDAYYKIAEFVQPKYLLKNSYDYIYPYKKTYYLYDNNKNSWMFLNEKLIFDGSEEKNITRLSDLLSMLKIPNIKVQNSISKIKKNDDISNITQSINWEGTYHLNVDYGKLDENSEMSIDYTLEVKNNTCTFSGLGYKAYFTDRCTIEGKGSVLILKFEQSIDGDGFSDHSNLNLLGEINYKKGTYYLKSPIVADSKSNYNTEIKLEKSK
ncbi:DUF5991 domain-containing protein [Frigoriflavimonas asaccharolytica]|uniref:Uncharacterized protein n=1 Tax=Frigoriflavimonas asaccharolytica TaxID=2735899 RepID=A0A8J8G9Y4_9FLAO|nr:DUF5991 domain-containing protein [Frigoriflavimonas asaccharolytica]NRS94074.1 hypothetical protein [Frigoriflavimonas asaccharolytica]